MLDHSIGSYINTTTSYLNLLRGIGIETVSDFLMYYPRTHEDQTNFKKINEIKFDEKAILKGAITDIQKQRTKTGKLLIKAIFIDEVGNIAELVWFNQRFLLSSLPICEQVIVSGKPKFDFGKISIMSPTVELLKDTQIHAGCIVPVYREHDRLKTSWFREKMSQVIHFAEMFPENLPIEIIQTEKLIDRNTAIRNIHFPESKDLLLASKERLAFEELYIIQRDAYKKKVKWRNIEEKNRKQIKMDIDFIKVFFDILPFTLTNAQKVVLYEILKDLEKPFPMNRLLEGDVGSGKTVVVVAAALNVFKAGFQTAIMAPTEVLARQHFSTITKLIDDLVKHKKYDEVVNGIKDTKVTQSALDLFSSFLNQKTPKVGLLTGSVKGKTRKEVLKDLESGELNIIVGTHALIQDKVVFDNLGFVVIDEQHRFGVAQRNKLKDLFVPHVLNMSATPIPRSLALTAYGDQDLSVINEMPPGRKPIITKVVPERERAKVYEFIKTEIKKGRQIYVICPLIDESDVLEVKSVMKEYEFLKLDIFPEFQIGLMHGKLSPQEKTYVMNSFKEKELDILVSTSVIEVGIDVPNATIMIIEGAERFGLAQLHQFRGRVGRGETQSYCFLFTNSENSISIDRLKYMEEFTDGFKLAEIDLRLRGPGEVYGIKQSGIPDLRIASLKDTEMIVRVKKSIERTISKDSN